MRGQDGASTDTPHRISRRLPFDKLREPTRLLRLPLKVGVMAVVSSLMSHHRQKTIDVGRQECLPHLQTASLGIPVIAG